MNYFAFSTAFSTHTEINNKTMKIQLKTRTDTNNDNICQMRTRWIAKENENEIQSESALCLAIIRCWLYSSIEMITWTVKLNSSGFIRVAHKMRVFWKSSEHLYIQMKTEVWTASANMIRYSLNGQKVFL